MMRYCRRWLLAALTALGGLGGACAQPPALVSVYDELRVAIETEDTEAVLARLAPMIRLETSVQAGWLQELSAMFAQRESLAAEMRFDEQQVVGQRALLVVTWAFSGKTTETGEAWSATQQRLDYLVQKGPHWALLSSDALAPEVLTRAFREGRFADPDSGLECSPPAEWRLFALEGARVALTAWSPTLDAAVAWTLTDLPGTFTAEQFARGQQDAEAKLAPTLGLEFRDVSMEPDVFGDRPAFRVRRTAAGPEGLELYADATYCVVGSTLCVCQRVAMPPKAYATHQTALDQAVASSRLVEVEATALPAEAGRIDADKYVNEVHGCEIAAPPGWTMRVGQGQFDLQVTMYEPQGDSSISLGMIRLPDPTVTAEMAVLGDDSLTAEAFDGYELIKQGETQVGELPAYESITTFSFGGETRRRHRVYLVDGDRLFFMFADAAPAEKWARLSPLFEAAIQSFRLIETPPPE